MNNNLLNWPEEYYPSGDVPLDMGCFSPSPNSIQQHSFPNLLGVDPCPSPYTRFSDISQNHQSNSPSIGNNLGNSYDKNIMNQDEHMQTQWHPQQPNNLPWKPQFVDPFSQLQPFSNPQYFPTSINPSPSLISPTYVPNFMLRPSLVPQMKPIMNRCNDESDNIFIPNNYEEPNYRQPPQKRKHEDIGEHVPVHGIIKRKLMNGSVTTSGSGTQTSEHQSIHKSNSNNTTEDYSIKYDENIRKFGLAFTFVLIYDKQMSFNNKYSSDHYVKLAMTRLCKFHWKLNPKLVSIELKKSNIIHPTILETTEHLTKKNTPQHKKKKRK